MTQRVNADREIKLSKNKLMVEEVFKVPKLELDIENLLETTKFNPITSP